MDRGNLLCGAGSFGTAARLMTLLVIILRLTVHRICKRDSHVPHNPSVLAVTSQAPLLWMVFKNPYPATMPTKRPSIVYWARDLGFSRPPPLPDV